jgi:hypothetical protein
MPAAGSSVQASHFETGLKQGGVGRVVTCGTSLTGDAIAPDACQRCGVFLAFSQPNSSVQVVK